MRLSGNVFEPHWMATRDLLSARLQNDRDTRLEFSSPTRDIFEKTAAYLRALRTLGCRSPRHEETFVAPSEKALKDLDAECKEHFQCGYTPQATCQGRIDFGYMHSSVPFVR
jgi:hypothetical protein